MGGGGGGETFGTCLAITLGMPGLWEEASRTSQAFVKLLTSRVVRSGLGAAAQGRSCREGIVANARLVLPL